LIVTRSVLILLIASVFPLYSTQSPASQQAPPATAGTPSTASPQDAPLPDEGNIPEEDETEHKETEYHFNPIRARKELDTGMFYYRKKSYRAAVMRFVEATRWNPGYTEAYLKLGEAQAKLKHKDDAKKSLTKVVQLEPDSKEAKEAKKLIAQL
jgi:tetratricopeptide (TPR) repeat protein